MIGVEEFKKQRIQKLVSENNLDILVASLPENIYYMTGYESIGHRILHSTQIFAFYNLKNDDFTLVIPRAEIPTALERFPNLSMVPYGNFFFAYTPGAENCNEARSIMEKSEPTLAQALIKTIRASGISKGRIGIDESRISIQLWKQLENTFEQIEFIPAMDIFSRIRTIKHESEVKLLEKSAEIAERSMMNVLMNLKVGMSEHEIGRQYISEVTKYGADPFFNVVTIDERSSLADTINTNKKIVDGSIIRVDFGCIFQGYRSDLARTAVVGKALPKVEKYYDAILKGQQKAIAEIKPGIPAKEIFKLAVDTIRNTAIPHYERHHCGHGIGLEAYDPPSIAPGIDIPLEPGMVLCIETPYYELGWAGVQVEDTIVVTDTGYRFLSKSNRELIKAGA